MDLFKHLIKKTFYTTQSSIRYRIIGLVTISILLPVCLFGSYLYSFVYHTLFTENIQKNLNQSIQQLDDRLVERLMMVDHTSSLFLSNQVITSSLEELTKKKSSYYIQAKTRLSIETQLRYSVLHDYTWNNHVLKSIFIYHDPKNHYALFHTYLPNDAFVKDHIRWIKQSSKKNAKIFTGYSSSFKTLYWSKNIETLINKHHLGQLVLGIDMKELYKVYSTLVGHKEWETFIFDANGTILFHKNEKFLGNSMNPLLLKSMGSSPKEILIDSSPYWMASKTNSSGISSMILIPKDKITKKLNTMVVKYIWMIFLTALLSMIVSMFAVRNITKPIQDLIHHMSNIKSKDFKGKMPSYRYSELNEVSMTFNAMMNQIHHLFDEVYQKQILLKESELKALQAQINPHFLFNVLEVINWEARMSKQETIYEMVHSLGQLLRANLTFNSSEKVTIKQELEYMHFYIYLQKKRFEDRLKVHISIEEDKLTDYYLPKLCLQPIVENAIVHGLENKIGQGNLWINLFKTSKGLCIEIRDDGIGFDTHILKNLQTNHFTNESSNHVGISNVYQRIQLIYGKDYGLSIKSTLNEGTKVSIQIPFDRGDNKNVSCYDC